MTDKSSPEFGMPIQRETYCHVGAHTWFWRTNGQFFSIPAKEPPTGQSKYCDCGLVHWNDREQQEAAA